MLVMGGGDGWQRNESHGTGRCSTDSLGASLLLSADALTVGGIEGDR